MKHLHPPAPRLALTLLVLFELLACGGEERPRAEPQPLVVPSAAKAASDVQPSADELPVPEDFEAEAEREITRENLHAQLDAIERELGGTPRPTRKKARGPIQQGP